MGWKDLYELSPHMTQAEIRFEKRGSLLAVIGIVLLSLTGYQMANWVFHWPPPSLTASGP